MAFHSILETIGLCGMASKGAFPDGGDLYIPRREGTVVTSNTPALVLVAVQTSNGDTMWHCLRRFKKQR